MAGLRRCLVEGMTGWPDRMRWGKRTMERELMEYDVVIVGAGPSGLAAAIRLKQLAAAAGDARSSVCVIEKGSEVGAHILSGAVLEPRALDELIPDWQERGAPLNTPATRGPLPVSDEDASVPAAHAAADAQSRQLHHQPRQSVPLAGGAGRGAGRRDLSRICRRPRCCTTTTGAVRGVATGDMGIGTRRRADRPLHAGDRAASRSETLFAEGCRGSLTKTLIERFKLRDGGDPQTYAIGIKELWEIAPGQAPARSRRPHDRLAARRRRPMAGRFSIIWKNSQVSVGFVIGLDYRNPHLNPFDGVSALQDAPGDPAVSSRAGGAFPTARGR